MEEMCLEHDSERRLREKGGSVSGSEPAGGSVGGGAGFRKDLLRSKGSKIRRF